MKFQGRCASSRIEAAWKLRTLNRKDTPRIRYLGLAGACHTACTKHAETKLQPNGHSVSSAVSSLSRF